MCTVQIIYIYTYILPTLLTLLINSCYSRYSHYSRYYLTSTYSTYNIYIYIGVSSGDGAVCPKP